MASAQDGREVFRCFETIPPQFVGGGTYFPPIASPRVLYDKTTSPETRTGWLALGYAGPVDGLGAGFGLSHETRIGNGPSSWDDIANIDASTTAGEVSYRLETWTVYLGLELAQRWYLSHHWSTSLRGFVLPRLDIANTAGVPASLASFVERKGGAVFDLAFAGTVELDVQLSRQIAVHGAGLIELPRASSLFLGKHSDLKRTIYYDPLLVAFGLGLGATYTWNP